MSTGPNTLNEHGLAVGRDLKEELIGQLRWAVKESLTHLESPVLVHGVTVQNLFTDLTLAKRTTLQSHPHCITHCRTQRGLGLGL